MCLEGSSAGSGRRDSLLIGDAGPSKAVYNISLSAADTDKISNHMAYLIFVETNDHQARRALNKGPHLWEVWHLIKR